MDVESERSSVAEVVSFEVREDELEPAGLVIEFGSKEQNNGEV